VIDVYRNLNQHTWSLRDPHTRRVVEHAPSVEIVDAVCVVSERQRQRAVDEGRRNVHAYVRGRLVSTSSSPPRTGLWHRVRYNCFKAPFFVSADFPDAAILGAARAYFRDDGAAWMLDVQVEPRVALAVRRVRRSQTEARAATVRPSPFASLPTTTIPMLRSAVRERFSGYRLV
jgi:hypothetical protein